jgi:hypothetical protein
MKTISLATSATAPARKSFAVDTKTVIRYVLAEGQSRADLVEAIAKANYASPALMTQVHAARDWLRECAALETAGQTRRFQTFDAAALAHHLPLVTGTTSERKAKKNGLRLITEEQSGWNATYRQYWKRLLDDAGVAPVNTTRTPKKPKARKPAKQAKGNGSKRDPRAAAPIFGKPAHAAKYFQGEAALMLKTLNANRRAGSISEACVKAYRKAVADFTIACARAAKAK